MVKTEAHRSLQSKAALVEVCRYWWYLDGGPAGERGLVEQEKR